MKIIDIFRKECVQIGTASREKDAVLKQIAAIASKGGKIEPYTAEEIFKALLEREKINSTGFENGMTIPHCALENATTFVAGILIIPEGVDFDSTDGKPSKLFAFIVGPKRERNRHIQILSAISRMLLDEDTTHRLLNANDADEAWRIARESISDLDETEASQNSKPKNMFTIFIQREEYFNDILQIFSASVQGSIMVLETNNAGHYLNRLPLFAAYWSDSQTMFNRIITAVVDRDITNDLIRRINTIEGANGTILSRENTGVLVAVHELSFAAGSIEF